MKQSPFPVDRLLYNILMHRDCSSFTICELRDAYMARLKGEHSIDPNKIWRHLDKQVRRLIRSGWVVRDPLRKKRNQVFHIQKVPIHLILKLTQPYFIKNQLVVTTESEVAADPSDSATKSTSLEKLNSRCNETKMDLLATMSEAEQLKQILGEHPELRDRLAKQYEESCDKSSRLLGQFRALEKAVRAITAHTV